MFPRVFCRKNAENGGNVGEFWAVSIVYVEWLHCAFINPIKKVNGVGNFKDRARSWAATSVHPAGWGYQGLGRHLILVLVALQSLPSDFHHQMLQPLQ